MRRGHFLLIAAMLAATLPAAAAPVEHTLLLEGDPYRDVDGVLIDGVFHLAGDPILWEPGTSHTLRAIELHPDPEWISFPSRRHRFQDWSDGGAAEHEVIAPAEPTTYTARYVMEHQVDILNLSYVGTGTTVPTGFNYIEHGGEIEVSVYPDFGCYVAGWENPRTFVISEAIQIQVDFLRHDWTLETSVRGAGHVTPAPGPQPAALPVLVFAHPDPGYRLRGWVGVGEGSYSGADNPAPVTMGEEFVSQQAVFEPVRYEVSLSLSDTEPSVNRGGPLGVAPVYLWLVCGSGGPDGPAFATLELALTGTLAPLAFVPEPDFFSTGLSTLEVGTSARKAGPILVGRFLVGTPGEGSLCLDPDAATPALRVWDDNGGMYDWPRDVLFTGVRTDGGVPCRSGHGCRSAAGEAVIAEPATLLAPISGMASFDLRDVFPNPFSGDTTIRYDVARPQLLRISVYDVTGRRVRSLHDAIVSAGRSAVSWDGRDSDGQPVAAGVYFLRLQAEDVSQTRKVVRLDR